MILTVEEAKKKDCCSPAFLSTTAEIETGFCKGDKCMAWRWMPKEYYMRTGSSAPHGYCGLAGNLVEGT